MTPFELGKEAGRLVHRSVRIQLGKPGSHDKARKAMYSKATNVTSPWRNGRKLKTQKDESNESESCQ